MMQAARRQLLNSQRFGDVHPLQFTHVQCRRERNDGERALHINGYLWPTRPNLAKSNEISTVLLISVYKWKSVGNSSLVVVVDRVENG